MTRSAPAEAEPRWLSADERLAWLCLSGVLIRLPSALDAQLERDAGLSHFEYLALAMLSETPGRTLRMSQLAIVTNGSLSRLSHVARRLENQGFIRREQSADDGRYINAVLTDEGMAKVVATAPGHVAHVRSLVIDALTADELGALRDIAKKILERIDPCMPFDPSAITRGLPPVQPAVDVGHQHHGHFWEHRGGDADPEPALHAEATSSA